MRKLALFAALGVCLASSLEAQVVAPNANATTEGSGSQHLILDTHAEGATFQTAFAASQFSAIPIGSAITGIGFRLDGFGTPPPSDITYSTFQLQIGQSANALGSLSNTYADNLGADTVLAINGLTIPAGSFVDAAGVNPNPFYILTFGTPYIFNGGDLLVTVRQAGNSVDLAVDAVPAGAVTNTVASFAGPNDTTGTQGLNFFNAPIMEFVYGPASAVPEPSSWAIMLLGFGAIGLAMRRQRKRQIVQATRLACAAPAAQH